MPATGEITQRSPEGPARGAVRTATPPWPGWRVLAVGGAGALAALAVVLGGQPPVERRAASPVRWPILDVHAEPAWLRAGGPLLAVAATAVLVGCWLAVVHAAGRGRLGPRRILATAAVWAVPLLAGPPALSADVYDYLGTGVLLRRGLDAYRTPLSALHGAPVLAAVDPRWRVVRPPYGPVALLADRLAALLGGHSLVAGTLVLRAVAVAGVLLLVGASLADARGRDGAAAAPTGPRGRAVPGVGAPLAVVAALLAANPIVLLHLAGSAHVDALVAGLLAAAWWAHRAGRSALAAALATAAGLTKAPALLALAALLAWQATAGPRPRLRILARQAAATATVGAALTLAVPDGWGWVRTLATPGLGRTAAAPVDALAAAVHALAGVPGGTALTVCRLAGVAAGALAVLLLLATARHRPAPRTAGYALVATTLAGPVAYVWYLAAPLACLARTADVRLRRWIVAGCVVASATSLPSLRTVPTGWLIAGAAVAGLALAVAGLAVLRARVRPVRPAPVAGGGPAVPAPRG